MVIFTSWEIGIVDHDPMWLAGFTIFFISVLLRAINETVFYDDGCVFWPIFLAFKVFRVALIPLDPFLSLGRYTATGNWKSIVAVHLQLNRREKKIFSEMSVPQIYYEFISSLFGGGKWIILKMKNDIETDTGRMIIAEELCENIGGVLMSVSVLLGEGGGYLEYASLAIAGVSLLMETGHYIGYLEPKAKNQREYFDDRA